MRARVDDVSRRYAHELRQAAALGGLAVLLAGVVASMDTLMVGSIGIAPAALLMVGGAALALRVAHAPRSIWVGGLKGDLFFLGIVLALGGLIQMLHTLGVLFGDAPHLGVAATLATGAVWLLAGNSGRFKIEARVVAALQLVGSLMVFAACSAFVAVGLGDPHGQLASVSMILLACAGLALVWAGTRTPAVGWQRL
ncbi:MAG TPA: hypothetical protein VLA87_04985 [Gaiellaceae bacterium]|nr:hypothetical protein [Gaiellaceae bacterium]